ncbi:MAG: biopolymer transporter ExbD [Deltaproteobacteria bacterium]|nr:biopolymer transporter ExbD [Deltaproteobacteria bacterium]
MRVGRRGRLVAVSPPTGRRPSINVTPLVDVVLVLLILFMVLTPLFEKDLPIRIPESAATVEVSPSARGQIIVEIDLQGRLLLSSRPMERFEQYVEELRGLLRGRAESERTVFFVPEAHARYERLVTALDGARAAGAVTLGILTEPAPSRTSSGTAPASLGGEMAGRGQGD